MPRLPLLVALAAATTLAACGGSRADDASVDTAAAASAASAEAPPNGTTPAPDAPAADGGAGASAPIEEADLDRYERGLEGEIAGYKAAAEAVARARTAEDSAAAMLAALPRTMADSGARRAGLDYPRYARLEETIGTAISRSVTNPGLASMSADTSGLADLPAEAQARARANMAELAALNSDSVIYAGVPDALRPVLKQRAAGRLGDLWKERMKAQTRAAFGGR